MVQQAFLDNYKNNKPDIRHDFPIKLKRWPIVGHEKIISMLQKTIVSGRFSHAYLFVGPSNIGKMTVALNFAKSIQCEGINILRPCQKCRNCKQIDSGISLDTVIIKKGGSITINEIRKLKQKFNLKSLFSEYKICIIDDIANITIDAANSLLKFLEEPYPKTIIILITESIDLVLPTIISRCQIVNFLPISIQVIEKALNKAENRDKNKNINQLAVMSLGRPGLAFEMLKHKEIIRNKLKVIDELKSIMETNQADQINFVSSTSQKREEIKLMLNIWLSWFRDLLLTKMGCSDFISNILKKDLILKQASKYTKEQLQRIIQAIFQAKAQINQNARPRLVLEVLLLNFS